VKDVIKKEKNVLAIAQNAKHLLKKKSPEK
jgi:hypothetical protein